MVHSHSKRIICGSLLPEHNNISYDWDHLSSSLTIALILLNFCHVVAKENYGF